MIIINEFLVRILIITLNIKKIKDNIIPIIPKLLNQWNLIYKIG